MILQNKNSLQFITTECSANKNTRMIVINHDKKIALLAFIKKHKNKKRLTHLNLRKPLFYKNNLILQNFNIENEPILKIQIFSN